LSKSTTKAPSATSCCQRAASKQRLHATTSPKPASPNGMCSPNFPDTAALEAKTAERAQLASSATAATARASATRGRPAPDAIDHR
jgi:hypothetical protein